MRAPFLQIGGNKQFEMLWEANFTYDSSMPVFDNKPPFYPYTLDYAVNHECMITPCPSKSYPGLWVSLFFYHFKLKKKLNFLSLFIGSGHGYVGGFERRPL